MAFELAILLSTVALPAAITAVACYIAVVSPRSREIGGKAKPTSVHTGLAALGGALAIWLASGTRNGFDLWPTDSWLRVPIGAGLVAIASAVTQTSVMRESRWVWRSMAIAVATWFALPSGEGFSELMPAMPHWQLCMSLATLLGWWIAEQVEDRHVLSVSFSWLLLLGVGTFLIAQSFAKLAEIMLAVGTVFLIASAYSLRSGRVDILRAAVGPALFAFAAAVGNGQFNSFLGLPNWLSVLTMVSPAMAALPIMFHRAGKASWWPTVIVWVLTIGMALAVVRFSLAE